MSHWVLLVAVVFVGVVAFANLAVVLMILQEFRDFAQEYKKDNYFRKENSKKLSKIFKNTESTHNILKNVDSVSIEE